MEKTREQLKAIFVQGAEPNEQNFHDFIDSCNNVMDDPVPSHTHDAAAIVSGVLDVDRIPVLPSQNQIVSSGGLEDLTELQEDQIVKGTTVITTDGFRWAYKGTGDKLVSSNYIPLADITPEWATIANKPTDFTPSPHAHPISDVTGLQTALNDKAPKASVFATGTVISFQSPQIYGAVTPETLAITADHTGAVPSMVQLLKHSHSSAPSFSSEFKKIGGTYTVNVVNYIFFYYISSNEILYTISQIS